MTLKVFLCDFCLRHKLGIGKANFIRQFGRSISSESGLSSDGSIKKKVKKYTHTVILPKTDFPLRLDSSKRTETESFLFDKCKFSSLYKWQRDHVSGPEFILHDGPPYANGKPHMGHAINKILKDITVRHHLLLGHKIHFVPGWDCHGLPIELKVLTESEKDISALSPVEIRHRARKFAEAAIADQLSVFRSWGIMADWSKCYFTFNSEYIKNQFRLFLKMYDMGFIYRGVKPVFWSPSSRSALAESELEYNPQHRSTSVFLRLSVSSLPSSIAARVPSESHRSYALVWTTTPWTLPANQAVCFNPVFQYCLVVDEANENDVYILASEEVGAVQEKLGRNLPVIATFPGSALRGAMYRHPFAPHKELPFVAAGHVTTGKGTGLVHTAPAHGPDDFLVGLEHRMPVECLVDESGCYTEDSIPELRGLPVLSSGSEKVLQMLKAAILHTEVYVHSYPYDWRTKKPVIVRASQQWFIDTGAIKSTAIEKLRDVKVYPERGSLTGNTEYLSSQLEKRPYWCISRQRVWGVPIPVLYDTRTQTPVISRDLIEHFCNLLDKNGSDFWWTQPLNILAPGDLLAQHNLDADHIERGKDILDIWFDSGISWSSVLENDKVADLYLEGVDQFNGWFQSSLMTSVAVQGKSPYRSLFVHGFAVDEKGLKMSKSLGNVTNPEDITHGGKDRKVQPVYGVDTLRWWVACHATQRANIPVSPSIIQASADAVHKIRIVLRFLLGAVHDLAPQNVPEDGFYMLDHYLLHLLHDFDKQVQEMFNNYQYNSVCKLITNFVTNDVSALYCHLTKDRLYCHAQDAPSRRACQSVMRHILETVTTAIAPVLPFLAEEVFLHHPCKKDKEPFFFSPVKRPLPEWNRPEVATAIDVALSVKQVINKTSPLPNTWELDAAVITSGSSLRELKKFSSPDELSELFQVSCVSLQEGADEEMKVVLTPAKQHLCPRCRRCTSDSRDELCARCQLVVSSLPVKTAQAI
ncbi:isoleucine--tRNA ligase, mitochondrial [Anabrus simplex]|uniref:isoleucine--tRNA ligase, mitochondrial n=1 Tax=Anabrus simplex TaxID=316456 RepID=UPI0035A389D1